MIRSGKPWRRVTALLAAAAAAASALTALPTAASAAPSAIACERRANITAANLLECVTAAGVQEHLEAFQAIADANDGNRSVGTSGYDASVDYVVGVMEGLGWNITLDTFDFDFQPDPVLTQITPVAADWDAGYITGSSIGEATAAVTAVDVSLDPPRDSTSGCEPADFAGFPVGNIALVQRGTCNFSVKVENAVAAGATAVIIFNQGNTPDREGVITNVTLEPYVSPVPVATTSFEAGVSLAQAGTTATVRTLPVENRPQTNVIAELPGRNQDNVVLAGAHIDGVPEGAGINDNASGAAALLEVAQNYSKKKPENTIRFAFWAAEEVGLVGSYSYVDRLPQAERDRIALALNFDMIGSANYVYMIYDSDESGFPAPVPVPPGSVEIEDLFESYFTSIGQPYDDAEFSGRSDYAAFIEAGIPSGGLFTGAEEVKTEEQAAIWGGTAGEWLDPCYHQACDNIDNVDVNALEVNADAIALAVLAYSYSTESVNGVKGKKIPGGLNLPAPAGPQGTMSAG